jgi:tRNA modification GTPase
MPAFHTDDTIAAIASPPGAAPRGIVRLAGPDAVAVALATFMPDPSLPLPPRRPARLRGSLQVDGLRPPLPVALLVWPTDRSYTGQPSVEIHTVGSPPLLGLVLAHLLARGARLANPGEFTLRAFLSGRIDLTRAEAVLGVIDAATPAQVETALAQLAGGLAGPIARLRDRLLDVVAHLEAGLDFDDEDDVDPIARAALAAELDAAASEVAALAARLASRERPEGRPKVALAGPPNAGKSLLFNAMVGAPHALVSPVAGTTRDYLVAPCDCDGLLVDLIDTAGLDAPADALDAHAQRHRAAQVATADLVLDCRAATDATAGVPDREKTGVSATGNPSHPHDAARATAPSGPVPPGGHEPGGSDGPTHPAPSPPVGEGWGEGEEIPSRPGRYADASPSPGREDAATLPHQGGGVKSRGNPPSPSSAPPRLRVATKCDLAPAPPGSLPTSAATGQGLEVLRGAIAAALDGAADGDAVAATGARCRGSLADASRAIADAAAALAAGAGDELVAVDLRQALDDLGAVVGAVVTDDILDRVFARFCIGK